MKWVFLFVFTLLSAPVALAQYTLYGRVIDKETRQPLEPATVTLTYGDDKTLINYVLTDKQGRFSLTVSSAEVLNVSVFFMGYRTEVRPAVSGKEMLFEMVSEVISLKEVEIKGGRISIRQDTVKYDLKRFVSNKDINVKDVLKKLPGIDVDEDSGEIKYKGKSINNFYVEGMDVTGGSYNQINENLKADAVESAEVIEHHQAVRSLRNKVPTDNVALNLKLKPEARSKWIMTASASAGYGDKFLYNGKLNALQLARAKQGLYTYKTDNSGRDLPAELEQHITNDIPGIRKDDVPLLVDIPTFSLPLEKYRLLDNTTHFLSLNQLYRKEETRQSRFSLRYLHDEQLRRQGTEETYFYTDTIRLNEQQQHRLRTDRVSAVYDVELNDDRYFGRNLLMINGQWNEGITQLSGSHTLNQGVRTSSLEFQNRYHTLYNKERYTWGIRSFLHYTYVPSILTFESASQSLDIHQAYTDNQLYYLWKHNGLSLEWIAGANATLALMKQAHSYTAHGMQIYTHPSISWEKDKVLITAKVPLVWELMFGQDYSAVHPSPQAYLRYKLDSRWMFSAFTCWLENSDNVSTFYPHTYYADYRTQVKGNGKVTGTQSWNNTLYAEYKRVVKEFFWTLQFSYFSTRYHRLVNTDYTNGLFQLTTLECPNRTEAYQVNTVLSKGFYDWNLKTNLEVIYDKGKGEQSGQGQIRPYFYQRLNLNPKLSWSPYNWLDAGYQAKLTFNESSVGNEETKLPALWSISHKLSINLGSGRFSINLTGEYYYNELNATDSQRIWLADIDTKYSKGKWRFNATLHNLFDKRQYYYSTYSDVRSYTSWMDIRPREFLLTAQYQW